MHEKLKETRKSKKLTCLQMAQKLGISKPYYWQIENGVRNLSYEMAVRIAVILKTKPDKIFFDDFNK